MSACRSVAGDGSRAGHAIDMAKSPEFTSRQNKTGRGKKFRKLFQPNTRNQRFG